MTNPTSLAELAELADVLADVRGAAEWLDHHIEALKLRRDHLLERGDELERLMQLAAAGDLTEEALEHA